MPRYRLKTDENCTECWVKIMVNNSVPVAVAVKDLNHEKKKGVTATEYVDNFDWTIFRIR